MIPVIGFIFRMYLFCSWAQLPDPHCPCPLPFENPLPKAEAVVVLVVALVGGGPGTKVDLAGWLSSPFRPTLLCLHLLFG